MGLFRRKKKIENEPDMVFDPAKYKAVLRCSICNGEQVFGFKELETGKFSEISFIRNEKELKEYMDRYNLKEISKEY